MYVCRDAWRFVESFSIVLENGSRAESKRRKECVVVQTNIVVNFNELFRNFNSVGIIVECEIVKSHYRSNRKLINTIQLHSSSSLYPDLHLKFIPLININGLIALLHHWHQIV